MVNALQLAAIIKRQKEAEEANQKQKEYVAKLRSGQVNIATALLKPQTTQSYTKGGKEVTRSETSINIEKYFKERGYDISKPDSIPNSAFYLSKEKSEARKAAEQRTEDLKKRAAAEAAAAAAKRERMITVSNNSKALPSYTAQTQRDFSDVTKYKVHGNNNRVSNNKVTPESVYVNPNVTVTGKSKTSVPSYASIAASENYNTATAMNDFMSANPTSDVNMGAANPQTNIWWKSSAPQSNSVQTEDLGGDIQHQETDNYTNVKNLPFQNSPPSNTNWADSFSQISVGTIGLGLAAIGVLLQLRKKK